jgi:hypothetical protein
MRFGRFFWPILVGGGAIFQVVGCEQTAYETLVRIGFSTVFLPINQAVTLLLS